MNPFKDQEKFMTACDQTVDQWNTDQFAMYLDLIDEEHTELDEAIASGDRVEQLDALIDILVVTIGAIHSAGFDGQAAWDEVMQSNFAKIGIDGKVRKREDGKILKPEGWGSPQLNQFLVKKK